MNTKTDNLLFAAIADDDTGASDLAGMLKEQGVETLLATDLPDEAQLLEWSRGYQAVVLAVSTRSVTPELARQRTREAIALLQIRQPQHFFIKYCSTFDSTAEGNIGPAIDAALEALHEVFTVAVPALPINGRTTYQGHHFVHRQLLSDSPLRHHPLNPMTNANLVEWLSLQTRRKVGLVVAGGETSGALCRRLDLGAFRVGKNIDPGVPLCYSLGKFKLPVVLKSGNFGAPDFYLKAANAISRWKEYLQ